MTDARKSIHALVQEISKAEPGKLRRDTVNRDAAPRAQAEKLSAAHNATGGSHAHPKYEEPAGAAALVLKDGSREGRQKPLPKSSESGDGVERSDQQRALELERARLASVLEATSDFVAFTGLEGGVQYVNPAGRRMLGLGSREDVTKSRIADYHPAWATERIMKEGVPAAIRLGLWSGETALLARDGSEIPISQVIVAHKAQDGTINFLSTIARDITERKRIESDLEHRVQERTAELMAVNKELEAFGYTVSHDLRAPLRNMSGFIELLWERSKPILDEKATGYVKLVRSETRRLASLIDDLLAFSCLGRSELHKGPVSLNELIAEVRAELHAEAAGRGILWKIETLPVVQADPALLRQVFANLIGNAVKYTRKTEQAQIEVGCLSRRHDLKEWIFFVRDNGVGFEMKYAEKIFGVFQRLHSHSEFEGTGVGLANVQRIVQRHGGRVWAEAELNKGATFYFSLPR